MKFILAIQYRPLRAVAFWGYAAAVFAVACVLLFLLAVMQGLAEFVTTLRDECEPGSDSRHFWYNARRKWDSQ